MSKNWQTHPVNIVALNVGWLLNKEEGYNFLCAIDNNQNLELYNVKAIQMMIE